MAHIGQERSLGFIRRFRCSQGLMQSLVLLHGLACLQIHIHKAGSNRMDLMIPAVLRMAHAGESNLFPEISVMPTDQITIRDDTLLLKLGSDILRLNETKEFLQVLLANVLPSIGSHGSQIRESLSHLKAFFQVFMGLIADAFIFVQVKIVDAPVVRGKRRDQTVLFFLMLLL